MATYLDIVNAAKALYDQRDKYCYFYGAKGQVLTDEVMNALWKAESGYFARYDTAKKIAISIIAEVRSVLTVLPLYAWYCRMLV